MGTGYTGRVGVYEFLPVDNEMREFLLTNPSIDAIRKKGVEKGLRTLRISALDQVILGTTSLDEALQSNLMAVYQYEAFAHDGTKVTGIVEASTLQLAQVKLRSQGLFVKVIHEDSAKRDRELFPALAKYLHNITRKERLVFLQDSLEHY